MDPFRYWEPLVTGAPKPQVEKPITLARSIHFFPPHVGKIVDKLSEVIPTVDVLCGNLEDGIPSAEKENALKGLIQAVKSNDFGNTDLWVRVNQLSNPLLLDEVAELIAEIGDQIDVLMIPKVESPEDIFRIDWLLALHEARVGLKRQIQLHFICETALGFTNFREIAIASPRNQGASFGPADFAADFGLNTTQVGGGNQRYQVMSDFISSEPDAERQTALQDMWHYPILHMVAACKAARIRPYWGPYGATKDPKGCETQFRAAFLLGCEGAWTLHPEQIPIANREFSPSAEAVDKALRIIDEMGDGSGTVMIDGEMQDDATVKEALVTERKARLVAARDPEYAELYGFDR